MVANLEPTVQHLLVRALERELRPHIKQLALKLGHYAFQHRDLSLDSLYFIDKFTALHLPTWREHARAVIFYPINMLIGTHDSGTHVFDFGVSFWNVKDSWEWLRLAACCLPWLRNKVVALSQAQTKTLAEQLEAGVDVLDLRVSFARGHFYTSHTFACESLETALAQITEYCKGNTRSIGLLIKPDYNNLGSFVNCEPQLLELLVATFSGLIAAGQIVLYYGVGANTDLSAYPCLMDLNNLPIKWYDVNTVGDFISDYAATDFSDHAGVTCVLTPKVASHKVRDIIQLEPVSLTEYAAELNPVATQLLQNTLTHNEPQPKFALFDHVDAALIDTIHQL
jgi:hypothetical protein